MPSQVASAGRTGDRISTGTAFEEYPIVRFSDMVGLDILPVFNTAKRSSAIPLITRESILRRRNIRRAAGAAYSRDSYATDELTYTCHEYGTEQVIDDTFREVYANDFDADLAAQQLCESILRREQEIRIEAAIFNGTTWPSGTAALCTDVSTDWDSASSTVIADIIAGCLVVQANCGIWPNTLVVSSLHIKNLMSNTDLLGRMSANERDSMIAILTAIPALTGVNRLLIAAAQSNAGGEGETLSLGNIWDDDSAWLGVCATTSNIMEPCVGRTMLWTDDSPEPFVNEWYREDQTRGDVWRCRHYVEEKIFDPYFAHRLIIDT